SFGEVHVIDDERNTLHAGRDQIGFRRATHHDPGPGSYFGARVHQQVLLLVGHQHQTVRFHAPLDRSVDQHLALLGVRRGRGLGWAGAFGTGLSRRGRGRRRGGGGLVRAVFVSAAGQPERQEGEHRGDVPDTPPGTPAAPASGVGADPAHDRFHLPPRRHHGDGVRVPGTPRDQPSKARTPEAVVGTRRLFVYSCPSASAIRPSVVSEVNQTRTPLRDLRTRLHRLRTRLRSLRSRAFDLVTHNVGAGVGGSRTVTARIYLG